MPAPGTPKQRLTRQADATKSGQTPKTNPKPARAPKPPKNKATPARKQGEAPFDVRSIVSKLNKRNIHDQQYSDSEESVNNENDSAVIEVCDDLKSKGSTPMQTEETKNLIETPTESIHQPLPSLNIPDSVRQAVGPNWRLKEAILNSYHFGRPSIWPMDFARSKLDIKTADIIANNNFAKDAKKHAVKLFLGEFNLQLFSTLFQPFLTFFNLSYRVLDLL